MMSRCCRPRRRHLAWVMEHYDAERSWFNLCGFSAEDHAAQPLGDAHHRVYDLGHAAHGRSREVGGRSSRGRERCVRRAAPAGVVEAAAGNSGPSLEAAGEVHLPDRQCADGADLAAHVCEEWRSTFAQWGVEVDRHSESRAGDGCRRSRSAGRDRGVATGVGRLHLARVSQLGSKVFRRRDAGERCCAGEGDSVSHEAGCVCGGGYGVAGEFGCSGGEAAAGRVADKPDCDQGHGI